MPMQRMRMRTRTAKTLGVSTGTMRRTIGVDIKRATRCAKRSNSSWCWARRRHRRPPLSSVLPHVNPCLWRSGLQTTSRPAPNPGPVAHLNWADLRLFFALGSAPRGSARRLCNRAPSLQVVPMLICFSSATRWRASATALAAAAACAAQAQTVAGATSPPVNALAPVIVTGNPLRNTQADAVAQRLDGAALDWRRAGTLGETLDGLIGVSATAFGPNSSRPVLRGLDGDRLRILNNGGATVDASSLSFDHAVTVDPLVIDAIEVVRGPAALLYGGNALGGVVNTLDNRIPRGAGTNAIEMRLGGAAQERAVAAVLEGGAAAGQTGWSWHTDASRRLSNDLRTPTFVADGVTYDRVRNSASAQRSAAVGAAYNTADGFVGLSVDDLRNGYGVTSEEDVRIAMQRQHLAQQGEWRWSDGWLRRVSWQASSTRYAHDEIEGSGDVGTQFRMRGSDGRVELEHAPIGALRGVVGLAVDRQRFSALGEEAFVPSTNTKQQSAFLFEEWRQGAFTLAGGARLDKVTQNSAGDADPADARFGPALARRFSPKSASVQATWQADPAWRLQLQAAQSERAPTHYELYANGVHLATAAFELGDPALGIERAQGLDAALVYEVQGTRAQLNVFRQRFSRYIALSDTGGTFQEVPGGETVPIYAFTAVPALLRGWELSLSHRLAQPIWGGRLQLGATLDSTIGTNTATGEPLPRLAPRRTRLSVDWQGEAWTFRAGVNQTARQNRVSADDQPVAGYTLVELGTSYRFKWSGLEATWNLKAQNVGDRLAYSAVTVPTLRDLAPLAGRSVQTSLNVRF
jgi:iron complex outermembrane recepter protein